MKKIFLSIAVLLLLLASACTQKKTGNEIPITTSSEVARELFYQARYNLENGEYRTAANLLEQAMQKDSGFVMAYCYRAMTGGGTQVMYANLNKAKTLAPNVSHGEELFVNYIGAIVDYKINKVKIYLDTLLSMYPQDKHLLLFASFYFNSIKDYKTAINYLKRASEIDSEFAPAYNLLGYMNVATENYKNAEANFKKYIQLLPDRPNPYDSYAEFLQKRGRFDESIAQYNKAFGIDTTFISALIGLGDNYIFKGDYVRARYYYDTYFNKAMQVDEKLDALYLRAVSYIYENKPDDAVKAFEEWRALAEEEDEPETILSSHLWHGFALTEMGKPAEGLKKIKDAVSVFDNLNFTEAEREKHKAELNSWLAYGYYNNNMMDEAKSALALYNQDVEMRNDPVEKSTAIHHQSLIDLTEGRYDDAIEKLSNIEPDPLRLYYMAQAHLKKGNKKEAANLLNKITSWNKNTIQLAAVWLRAHNDLKNNKFSEM